MGNSESVENNSLKNSPNFKFLAKLFEDNSTAKGNIKMITKSSLNKLFIGGNAQLSNLLYEYFNAAKAEDQNASCAEIQKFAFVNGFDKLLKLDCESQDMIEFYFDVFSGDLTNLLSAVKTVLSYNVTKTLSDENLETQAKSLLCCGKETLTKDSFVKQVSQLWPRLFNGIHWCILRSLSKLDGSNQITCHYKKYPKIQLITESSTEDNLLGENDLWILSVSIPPLFLKHQQTSDQSHEEYFNCLWKRLYDSNEHGLSHNRFKHHCFSYRGSTAMVVLLENDTTLVLTLDTEWKESSKCFGDSNTRLYQLYPEFKLLGDEIASKSTSLVLWEDQAHRTTLELISSDNSKDIQPFPISHYAEKSLVLYNEKSRGLPIGLTLGTNPGKPIVSLVEGLTLAKLNYLGMEQESVRRIEVWGCAGAKADVDQKQQQKWERRQAEQLQKVKLPGTWDENPDKALLEMAGVTTEHAQK